MRIVCFVVACLFANLSFLENVHALTVTRGPYLQQGTPTSVVVRWKTDTSTESVVRYGTVAGSLTQSASNTSAKTDHVITISNLLPNTKYFYSVGNSSGSLAGDSSYFFVTSPTAGSVKATRVWVIGDSGTADANARAVRDAYINFTGSRHTDLWLMLGDNAYQTGTDSEYQNAVFNMYPSILRKSVLWPTFGNHDAGSAASGTQSGVYYGIFTLPKQGEAGGVASGTEAYYSFDYANIHFICLNSQDVDRSPTGTMMTWLKNDLASTRQHWIIAFFHHPPYTKGSHNSDTESQLIQMRQNALPILEGAGVDLVLTGHSHSYERSKLINGHYGSSTTLNSSMVLNSGSGRSDGSGAYQKTVGANKGAIYAVAGSSGKISGGALNHPVMYVSLNVLGSMVLDINNNQMDVVFLDNVGARRDYFTMIKGGGNAAPSVTLASPANGTSYSAPATVALSATASDSNGTIAKVEFFNGPSLIGTDSSSPYSMSWNNVAGGNYALTAKATDNGGATSTSAVSNINVIASGGAIAATKTAQPASLSLSTEGTSDWSHWGLNTISDWNHKGGITAQISNFTKVGTGSVNRYTDGTMSVNWSGGTPTASSTGTTAGLYQGGVGNGFQISVPADTTERTLKVYCGVWKAQGRLEASLSDGSAPVLVDTTHGSTTGSLNTAFTINYKAASAGQSLRVKWTVGTSHDTAGNGTVGFQAATLSSGGVVDPCVGNTAPTVSISSPASGATFTAPASITINATANDSTGTISKVEFFNGSSLLGSDPSSPYSFNWSNVGAGVYSLTARATDSCSAMTTSSAVSVTVNSSSTTSSNVAPTVSLTSPVSGATYTAPATVAMSASAGDSDGTVSGVDFLAGTTLLGSDLSAPYSLTWANVGVGVYSLTARATDNAGASTTSSGVSITVNSSSSSSAPVGSLSATKAAQPTSLSLNVEGSRDWSHWGLNASTDWNHKSGVTAQITNITKVGTGTVNRYTDGTMAVSWTGGTPTASASSTRAGIYVAGVNNGFQITVPADTTARTLKVYCGVWKSQGKLEATLSDGSAPAIVDTTHGSTTGSANTMFTINYNAASAGQSLTVKWTVQTSHDTAGAGTVGWQTATLQ